MATRDGVLDRSSLALSATILLAVSLSLLWSGRAYGDTAALEAAKAARQRAQLANQTGGFSTSWPRPASPCGSRGTRSAEVTRS